MVDEGTIVNFPNFLSLSPTFMPVNVLMQEFLPLSNQKEMWGYRTRQHRNVFLIMMIGEKDLFLSDEACIMRIVGKERVDKFSLYHIRNRCGYIIPKTIDMCVEVSYE